MARTRAEDYDDKRALIFERAAELFAESGFERASIADLALRCRASKSWIYHYFPSKEAILYGILLAHMQTLRAGFVFLSGILYTPPRDFWELPETFAPAHQLLEDAARSAGLGVLTLDERRDNWRQAVLKMKGFVEPHGVVFPALPEIGIEGEAVKFDIEDIIPVF